MTRSARFDSNPDVSGTLAARHGISRNNIEECVAVCIQSRMGSGGADHETETLIPGKPNSVRRLTPTECEALQGFPINHTSIQHRGRHSSDSVRYRALGNSMAVSVMRWLGGRIHVSM